MTRLQYHIFNIIATFFVKIEKNSLMLQQQIMSFLICLNVMLFFIIIFFFISFPFHRNEEELLDKDLLERTQKPSGLNAG